MSKALVVALAAVVLAAVASAQYGSYVTVCTPTEVHFHNFAANNCVGNYTTYTKPLGGCHEELILFSWNAACGVPNASAMQYYNYDNRECKGKSVLTRTYIIGQCFNCPNPECKNP